MTVESLELGSWLGSLWWQSWWQSKWGIVWWQPFSQKNAGGFVLERMRGFPRYHYHPFQVISVAFSQFQLFCMDSNMIANLSRRNLPEHPNTSQTSTGMDGKHPLLTPRFQLSGCWMILRKRRAAVGPLTPRKAFQIQFFKQRTCVKSTTEPQARFIKNSAIIQTK